MPVSLTVCGEGTIERNAIKAKEIWGDYEKIWFPEGPQSPDIAILEVSPIYAEYWKIDESIVRIFWELTKSQLTKSRPDIGKSVRIDVSE